METNWKLGDIIKFCDELYVVLENYGSSGKVRELGTNATSNKFYWEFDGEKCVLVRSSNTLLNPKEAKVNKE